jgi:hypothetical protein
MPELLEQSLDQLEKDSTAKLAMELVATRDILAGDEVFLNYGDDWEEAWQEHVQTWKPVDGAATYLSAEQLNSGDLTKNLRTVFEQMEDPYPSNVQMHCDMTFKHDNREWKKHDSNGTLDKYLEEADGSWWPCDVLRKKVYRAKDDSNKNKTRDMYTAHMYETDEDATDEEGTNYLVESIPREAFHFVDRPYTSDTFVANVFRHDIRIPDDMFPVAWKNLREKTEPGEPAVPKEQKDEL